jgi:hypothetical protein
MFYVLAKDREEIEFAWRIEAERQSGRGLCGSFRRQQDQGRDAAARESYHERVPAE